MSESVKPNPDYREDTDIARVHASVKREKTSALTSGREPASLWVFLACAMVLLVGGGYLGAYSGSFRPGQVDPMGAPDLLADRRPSTDVAVVEEDPFTAAMNRGAIIYANCAGCHQASGAGVAGAFPPLEGSEWVLGSPERMAAIILRGLAGPITVKGSTYNGQMQKFNNLTDEDIAAVMTYVRNSWGNEASMVTGDMVAYARDIYEDVPVMTEELLLEIPEDKELPGADPEEGEATEGEATEGEATEGEATEGESGDSEAAPESA